MKFNQNEGKLWHEIDKISKEVEMKKNWTKLDSSCFDEKYVMAQIRYWLF